jgi:hypothetical protein
MVKVTHASAQLFYKLLRLIPLFCLKREVVDSKLCFEISTAKESKALTHHFQGLAKLNKWLAKVYCAV